jgi:hypothetical protein
MAVSLRGSSYVCGATAAVVATSLLGLLAAVNPNSQVCLNKTSSPSHLVDLFTSFPAPLLPRRDPPATDTLRLRHRPIFAVVPFPTQIHCTLTDVFWVLI